jgi:hypothetical protein
MSEKSYDNIWSHEVTGQREVQLHYHPSISFIVQLFIRNLDHKFTRRLSTSEVLLCGHNTLRCERILFVNSYPDRAILD